MYINIMNGKMIKILFKAFKKGIKWWIKDTYTKYMKISCLLSYKYLYHYRAIFLYTQKNLHAIC